MSTKPVNVEDCVVEIVSGQSFDQFLRERIFDPLGMKDTVFNPSEDRLPRLATTYRREANALVKFDQQPYLAQTR